MRITSKKKSIKSSRSAIGHRKSVMADFDARIPDDKLYDPDKFDLSGHIKNLTEKDKAMKQEKYLQDKAMKQKKYLQDKYGNALRQIEESEDKIQTAFDLLVPRFGPAETIAGELVRAMMRILYRDYNDGDVFYEGYGLETCASAAVYIANIIPGIWDKLEDTAYKQLTGSAYTAAIEEMSKMVIDHLLNHVELFDSQNVDDCLDCDISDIKEMEPKYEIDITIPKSVQWHIDEGHISTGDIVELFEDHLRYLNVDDADVSFGYSDVVYISNITIEVYEELEENGYDELIGFGHELDEEYGSEEDSMDEYE